MEFSFYFQGAVRLTPNVALGGTATQSSVHTASSYAGSSWVAGHANDGDLESKITRTSGACSYTKSTPPVWWQVELQEIYEVTKVAITERKGFGEHVCSCILPMNNFHSYLVFSVSCLQG